MYLSHFQRIWSFSKKPKTDGFFGFSDILISFQNYQNCVSFKVSVILKKIFKSVYTCLHRIFREHSLKKAKERRILPFSDIMIHFQNRQNGVSFAFSELLKNVIKRKNKVQVAFSENMIIFKTAQKQWFFVFLDILISSQNRQKRRFFRDFIDFENIKKSKTAIQIAFLDILKNVKKRRSEVQIAYDNY